MSEIKSKTTIMKMDYGVSGTKFVFHKMLLVKSDKGKQAKVEGTVKEKLKLNIFCQVSNICSVFQNGGFATILKGSVSLTSPTRL